MALITLDADASDLHNAIIEALEDADTLALWHLTYVCTRTARKTTAADLKHCRALLAAGVDHEEVAALYIAQHGGRQLDLPIPMAKKA